MPNADPWSLFSIRIVVAGRLIKGVYRVVFEHTDPQAAIHAAVTLRAGGDRLVRYTPPVPDIPGITRDMYIQKAAELVQARLAKVRLAKRRKSPP